MTNRPVVSRNAALAVAAAVAAAALLSWPSVAAADDSAKAAAYAFREAEPVTGTSIKRDLFTWVAPFNKRYAELTPEQQRAVKADCGVQADADEPPFPVNGLGLVARNLGRLQQRLQAEGPLLLRVDIDEAGLATSVSVFKSPNPDVMEFVAKALLIEKYKPAVCGGKACAMPFVFGIDMLRGMHSVTAG